MSALDRQVAAIIADALHRQDPRFTWAHRPTTSLAPPAPTSEGDR